MKINLLFPLVFSLTSVSLLAQANEYHYLNTKTGWFKFESPLVSMRLAGSNDKSVEEVATNSQAFRALGWYNRDTLEVEEWTMNGEGNYIDHLCSDGYIVSSLYYFNDGDDSIEQFRCRKLLKQSAQISNGNVNILTLKSNGVTNSYDLQNNRTIGCGDNEYIVGFQYKDDGDDYITKIYCKNYSYVQ
ncbi:hypothetical protein [Vibrio quintilis]|uniref:Membrane-bound lysozyme-inhibitor of c-type lysozyme n=1 Tax=Vibrio quintilis TaxID=1117707 RepID=A0A1M7YPZ4_9VIBR|nr:hypothetical protein [Vibrio quintilis]SHO54645.1 hypothetical protein VQ7734_00359 [Vibrio quintilis]